MIVCEILHASISVRGELIRFSNRSWTGQRCSRCLFGHFWLLYAYILGFESIVEYGYNASRYHIASWCWRNRIFVYYGHHMSWNPRSNDSQKYIRLTGTYKNQSAWNFLSDMLWPGGAAFVFENRLALDPVGYRLSTRISAAFSIFLEAIRFVSPCCTVLLRMTTRSITITLHDIMHERFSRDRNDGRCVITAKHVHLCAYNYVEESNRLGRLKPRNGYKKTFPVFNENKQLFV